MIFCVEDDQSIRDLMIYTLKASGFEARGFVSGEELFPALAEETPELILLDIMLPGEDGISILKKLRGRQSTAGIPVIMASAKGTEFDKVTGLDLGADDYLAKPFGMMEMVSRVRAVLRRSGSGQQMQEEVLTNGGITLDEATRTVTASGRQVQLTLKEYELLRLFMRNPGRVYTRDSLLSQIWGMDFAGESRTIDVHIGTLRSKLSDDGECIMTVRGVGYRMEKR